MQHRLMTLVISALVAGLGLGPAHSTDVPKSGAATTTPQPAEGQTKSAPTAKKPARVDINSATVAQLKKVPGIDAAHAEKIVRNRPYPTRSHLVTKEVLSYDAYMAVKDYLVANPPEPSKAKK
jgi:competence protein ComEA